MRKVFIVLGAAIAFFVGVGIFLFLQFTRPTVLEVPVAISDISAGTVIKASLFRVARFSNVDAESAAQWVTVNTWVEADGKVTNSDIRAGFPVARSQIDPAMASQVETRLSTIVTGTDGYYVVIATKPDEVGNFIQPGDRVDVIVSLGGTDSKDTLSILQEKDLQRRVSTGGEIAQPQDEITETTPLPITKLVMQNLSVLRVEREPSRGGTTATNQQNQGQNQQQQPAPLTPNDVKRLYVQVDRDQLEVLSFVLNNGRRNFAVRAASGSQERAPTDGVTWSDFVRWFYAQRGGVDNTQPFDAISPANGR
jgi:Flp pilus assembly protein CpaB